VKVELFIEKFPEAVEDFRNAWIQYMKYCYQVESGEVVESVTESRSTTLINLDRDPKGYPLVPQEGGNLIKSKRIIRSFLTAHYRNYYQFYYIFL
jgi:ABC-type nitrate/sulfonate/bicarbonate transport system substrate-binding protein